LRSAPAPAAAPATIGGSGGVSSASREMTAVTIASLLLREGLYRPDTTDMLRLQHTCTDSTL
jgi:hypothetical protein